MSVVSIVRRARERLDQLRSARRDSAPTSDKGRLVDDVCAAVNRHDLDGLTGFFHEDFHGEQPLHPGAGETGRDQLRRNWEAIFGNVPDVRADVLRTAVDDETVWSEWRIYGTRRDGRQFDLRSVWIIGVRDGAIVWGRLYREPLDAVDLSPEEAIDRLTRPN